MRRRLYVKTAKGDKRPQRKTRGLARSVEEWIRGEDRFGGYSTIKAGSSVVGRVSGDEDLEEVLEHPLLDLLAKPNPFFDGQSLNKTNILYLDTVGAGYWFMGDRNKLGTPKELWPLPSQQVWPWREDPDSNRIIDCWLFTSGRQQYRFDYKDVLQFHYFNPYEPYSVPLSPLQACFEHVTVTEQSLSHQQSLYENQARPDMIVTPNDVIGEPERRRLEINLNNKFRGAGTGSAVVAESAFKMQPLQWAPVDMGMLDLYAVTYEMICDAYGVPQSMVSKDTNLANLQASLMQHAMYGILPRLNCTDEAINRLLVPLYDESGRLFVVSDNPIKEDRKQMLEEVTEMLDRGVMVRNEGRTFVGLPQVPWGDQPLISHTQAAVDMKTGKPIIEVPAIGRDQFGHGSDSRKPKPSNGSGSSGSGGSSNETSKPPKKKPKKGLVAKSIVDSVARLAKEVSSGNLTPEAASWALSKEHGLNQEESLAHFQSATRSLENAIAAALAFCHLSEMDEQTELRVSELWATKGNHDHLKWEKPNFSDQKDQEEIERACKELEGEDIDIGHEELTKIVKAGEMVDLKDKTWKRIKNTESLKVEKLRDVLDIAHRNKKKVRGVLQEFLDAHIRAPMVLQLPDGDCWLINGNTRLCISHLFGIKPQVWYAKMPKAEEKGVEVDWRAKGREAAFQKLAAIQNGQPSIPVPFLVGVPLFDEWKVTPGDMIEKVQFRDLSSPIATVSVEDVKAALETNGEMSFVIDRSGTAYIQTGLADFVAAFLMGETEVEARASILLR
jgi:HK97 family phage portal protein